MLKIVFQLNQRKKSQIKITQYEFQNYISNIYILHINVHLFRKQFQFFFVKLNPLKFK